MRARLTWRQLRADRMTRLWDRYEHEHGQEAYEDMIGKTSTSHAPWYVVPADHNWVRNLAVAKILLDALQDVDPHFPAPDPNIHTFKIG